MISQDKGTVEQPAQREADGISRTFRDRLLQWRVFLPIAVVVGALAVLLAGWAADSWVNQGEVRRNVTVAGVDIGGLDRNAAEAALARADSATELPVRILTPDGAVETTAGAIGIGVDPAATVDGALAEGRGFLLGRPFSWLGTLLGGTTEAPVVLGATGAVDEAGLTALLDVDGTAAPVEPTVELVDGAYATTPGTTARGVDLERLVADLQASALAGDNPIEAEASFTEIAPTLSDTAAQAVADDLNAKTADGITVDTGLLSRDIGTSALRSWITVTFTGTEPSFAIDAATASDRLRRAFSDVISETVEVPDITVVDGRPVAEGDVIGQACCADGSADRLLAAIVGGQTTVGLELVESAPVPAQEYVEQLGITEEIASFTTPHACCEDRVINIQRIADIVRGAVIQPGEEFSLNEFVGQRTSEKGFVPAGVIYFGEFQTDVGGGVSQFATTIFNTAFYAGFDLVEYQSHSLYISRYPYGVEATISWPQPDIRIRNPSDHAVLIWPTYDDTSITVTFYSTEFATVETLGQYTAAEGECTRVFTDRERTFVDGSIEVDTITALYQPEEGIGCDGEPTNPDAEQGDPNDDPAPVATPEPTPAPEEPTPPPTEEPTPDPTAPPTEVPTEVPTEAPTDPPPPPPTDGAGDDGAGDDGGGGGGGGG